MADRIKFIINTSVDYFKLALTSKTSSIDENPIKDFLENDDIKILSASIKNDYDINFEHRIPTEVNNSILFYKIPQFNTTTTTTTATTNNKPEDVPFGILTLEGGLIKSIYNSLVRVYSPYITKRIEYTPELEKIIENLHSTLGSSLGLPQSGIHAIQDEIKFWTDKSINSITKSDKENAKMCVSLIEKLNIQIRELSNGSFNLMDDFLHSVNNLLDEIWRLPNNYPQNRMCDLMDIICSDVVEICSDNLNNDDIWNMNSFHITTTLNDVQETIDYWLQICDSLTRLFWPNYGLHPWIGEPYTPIRATKFIERLNEIKNIKNLFKQITLIFNHNNSGIDEQMQKTIKIMYMPFKIINIFDTTPFGMRQWQKATEKFEHFLEPIDEKMALIIKMKLHNHLENPRQVVHIFCEHDNILKRPTVMELLKPERDYFLQYLNVLIDDLKKSLVQNNKHQDNGNVSAVCWECRWLKVVEHQINEIKRVTHLIETQDGYEAINIALENLRTETENLLKTNFELWRAQSIGNVQSGELTLKDDKPVVEFEKFGRQLMQVTFKPKLIAFCNDVCEFENLGFCVPIELRDTAVHAKKFISYARRLQQIATFHNTIGDRMVSCQRPIMLKNAMELSQLVQSESVAWNDEESINRYVTTLQTAVSKLSQDNAFLVSQHEDAKKIIIKLMNTDLLHSGNIWKDEMRHLRDIIVTLETKGYKNLQVFKLHWDHQLYKVLEHQYLSGLADLNHKLPDIYVDIVFRQQQLQFRPTIEEIKLNYYLQLRQFLERPLGFHGLSDHSNNLFRIMVDRNRDQFGILYNKGEKILKQMCEMRDLWLPWVALGCVNLEELCESHLTMWEDWDRNFKECKHFSQQIAKIQNSEERIDCFVINLNPLRSDIEFLSRKYWETLTNSLRSSILKDITILQDFLHMSLKFLQNVPIDDFGINEAGAKYEKIMFELPKMSELLKTVEGKDKCLAGWCKERIHSFSTILTQWDQLQPLIENHSTVLQRQIDIMKDRIQSQMSNMQEEGEKFQIRWESMLNELETNTDNTINLNRFKEMQQNWLSLKMNHDQLIDDCKKYNIEFTETLSEFIGKLDNEIKTQSEQWECYEEYLIEFDKITMEEWTVYRRRPYILTDFITKWIATSSQSTNCATTRIRKILDNYQLIVPTLQNLQSDGLTEKHWAKIFSLLNQQPKPYHDICLKDILLNTKELLQYSGEIQNLVRQATSEQIVRQALTELDQWGVVAILKTTTHTDSKGNLMSLIKDYQQTLNKIGDNQCLLQSAKTSSAFDSFSDQADIWEGRLNSLDEILTSLNQIQRKWIYLDPIFGIGTLKGEEAIFTRIDKDFKYIMKEISNDSRVISIIKINNITNIIKSLENLLSKCQNTLISYITAKRNSFPRFYFLCDDDLLEILGQSTKIEIIQKHIKKLFPGIYRLGMLTSKENHLTITAIYSAEGEEINLKNPIIIFDGNNNLPVEKWLNQLVDEIKFTLNYLITMCTQINENYTDEHIKQYPIQVLCTSKAIAFTNLTEKAINSMTLEQYLNNLKHEIQLFSTMLVKYTDANDNLIQLKLRALLLDLVHYVTTIELLLKHNVTNLQDWFWLQQIKFYRKQSRDLSNNNIEIIVKMVYAEFEYSYEYLGNLNKLVYTKLTHNCYLTLTQAMHLGLGGNPFGPAGTGKTECVKALGAMLGRLVFVFNCNENVDTTAMGLILSGLARCGAWGCFDEFNRLQESTLSSISMLIQPLQTALKERLDTVTIHDKPIPLNSHCGIFVTLNPAGEEYGGRQNLPTNLQALFRPIVMQQPEPKDIASVMLFIEGFRCAKEIGARMVELFNLASKILSQQRHYEWGLRELKTVLSACGKLLHTTKSTNINADDEMKITIQALRSNTMSKLNLSDCKRFDMLIEYVFSNIEFNDTGNEMVITLMESIRDSFGTLGLQFNEIQMKKCLQLYEQLTKRMGVVVLGPPTSGKTTIISILKQALISTGKTIRIYTIAPKSMNRIKLLGKLDPDTRQWYDGVLTTIAVGVNNEPPDVTSWIICDGDVDPEWIEALNSVLDDNKLLTLPSGWRIQFGDNVNFIFETHDLSHASPATISRMGIINLSTDDLDPSIIINSWLQNQTNNELKTFIDEYFLKSINWIENLKDRFPIISKICLVKCGLEHLNNSQNKEEFCVNLLRGLGSTLPLNQLNKFAIKLFEWADIYLPDSSQLELCYYNKFRDIIEIHSTDDNISDGNLIKTANIKVYLDVIRNLLKKSNNPPFLIFGPSGSGKSLILDNIISEFSGYQLVVINCSAQLSSNFVLYILKQNCLIISGIRGREYKPKLTKLILYFKNIDLCNVDDWGTSEVIELLLQIIHRNGFYADTMEWINVIGVQICATISDESKETISIRYLSIQRILVTGYPNDSEMIAIIKNQLVPIYDNFNIESDKLNMNKIIDILIKIYSNVRKYFTVDIKNHYVFTPKMLTQLIANLTFYQNDTFFEALINECICIFRNRLICQEHTNKFDDILRTVCQQYSLNINNKLFFVPNSVKSMDLKSITEAEWMDSIMNNIKICNTEDILIEISINPEILLLIAGITRSLSRPMTHLVMCANIGFGRKESLHIACTMLHIKIFLLQLIKGYKLIDFYNDLKMAMQMAALEDQTVVLHIDHSWIEYCSDIMKPIEAILEGSEIPEIFGDDLETIATPLRNAAQMELYQESITSYFWKRVKKNLHLVISLENNSENLNELFNEYPALYRSTEMIWLNEFNDDVMYKLPENLIKIITNNEKLDVPIPLIFSKILQYDNKLTDWWAKSHRRYNQLIKSYYFIYQESLVKIQNQRQNLQAGIDKLSSANSIVESLKNNASVQEIALAEKRKLANQALEMISSTMRNATDQRTDLLELKKRSQENSEKLMERKRAIEIELMEVEPILKEASAAVGQIKGEALSEIRSLRAPPEIIRDILEGVLRLMGIRDTSWNSMKSFLAKRGVKEDIRSLDPARITAENCQTVEKLLKSKSESFESKNAKRASTAAAPLATWVIANVRYSKVCQSIKPLEQEQNQLEKNLNESENEMKTLMNGLNDVDARVKELSNQLNSYTQEAAILEIKLDEASHILKSSEILVEKLATEYENWNKQLTELNDDLEKLDIKVFMISFSINYLSHLTFDKRKNTINEIIENCNIFQINLTKILLTDQDKIMWQSFGLTGDVQSMENAALLIKILELPFGVAPIPFLIDPLQNAFEWLQKYLQINEKPFEIATQSIERFAYTLELAVRFGKILIVKDCEQQILPPILTIISTTIYTRFNKKLLYVGNKFVDFHENFKLIFITKLNSIQLGAEISPYITCIPFTTTISGLTDQLMSQSIATKQPELEQKRCKLLQNEGKFLRERLELQDKLLHELSAAQGDILKNEKLLKTLNEIKESTTSIDKSLKESADVRNKLTKEFEWFNEICQNAAHFFIGINQIYKNISVSVFLSLFLKCIKNQEEFDKNLSFTQLVRSTYFMLSRIVAKSDHLELGLNICKNAYPEEIPDKEWESFITNFMSVEDSSVNFVPPNWIKKELQLKIITLKIQHPRFYDALNLDNENVWHQFINQSKSINDLSNNSINISEFEKILTTQIFRPDLLIITIEKFIYKLLAINNMSIVKPTIEQLIDEIQNFNPILLIATGDSDPSKDIQDYVQQQRSATPNNTIKYVEIAVGEGQQEHLTVMELRKAAEHGYWICLKNIHLISTQWLIAINDVLQTIEISNGFCLWLICDSIKRMPESLLVRCNKVLYETPNGVKNKVQKLLSQWSHVIAQRTAAVDSKLIKLFFITFILNSVLQERRTYLPHGWSKWYEFGDSDLRAAIDIICWMENAITFKMEWSVVRGLIYYIAYGGRIHNTQDIEILSVHLNEFYNNKIMTPNWKPLNFKFNIPQSNKIQDYQNVIAQMSDQESPELFGLSSIKNSSRDILICRNLLKQLRSSYFLNENQENYEKRVKPILNLWKKLSGNTTIIQTYDNIVTNNNNSQIVSKTPWSTFLLSEIIIAGKLFKLIHKTLVTLHTTLKNVTTISKENKQIMLTICENQVPLKWRQLWSGPKFVIDFLKSVVNRSIEAERQYKTLMNLDFGDTINFTNIFSVESYLAALKLTNAKELQTSTCNLLITTSLTTQLMQPNCSKPTVTELMIDGASFQNNKICLSTTNLNMSLSNKITSIQITFIETPDHHTSNDIIDKHVIELPLYANTSRDHFICTLKLPIIDERESIILAGVALIVPD